MLESFNDEPYAQLLTTLIKEHKPEIVLTGATPVGISFFPRVAARLMTGLTADCTSLASRQRHREYASGEAFACAHADPKSDVRDLTVGMPIHAIPHAGYIDIACVDDASHKLPSWSAWRECPLGVNRLRAVRFGFDPTTSYGGTLIAGHPVTLTAFVDDAAILVGLEIDTDPKAKPFMRKKAFLLAAQVMSRYGAEDWNCAQRVPEPGERAVGGIFMKQIRRKALRNRVLVSSANCFDVPIKGWVTLSIEPR